MKQIQIGDDKISVDEYNSIVTGKRPDTMEYSKFKQLRTQVKKQLKNYMKGQYFFISSALVPVPDTKQYQRATATYIKPEKNVQTTS